MGAIDYRLGSHRVVTDNERATVVKLLPETIAADRFPLSPRVRSLQAIPDKLDPPPPRPQPLQSPKPLGLGTVLHNNRRR